MLQTWYSFLMKKRYVYLLSACIVVCVSAIGALLYFGMTASLPWVPTGRLAILVHSSPNLTTTAQLGLGIDDVRLHRNDGVVERATVLTRRILFDSNNDSFILLIDTHVPEGTYTGFSFVLKSPELRNAWQQDVPPDHVSLLNDAVFMDVVYQVAHDSLTAIMLGFETQRTLFEEEDGIVYLPVIQVETRYNTTLDVAQDGTATIAGGTINASATYGMDWDGRVRYNFRPKPRTPQETATDTDTYVPTEIPSIDDATTSATDINTDIATTSTTTDVLLQETQIEEGDSPNPAQVSPAPL